jgi:hypothetical protein
MTVVSPLAGLLLGLGIVWGHSGDEHDKLPAAASRLLDEADAIELISLDPRERPARPGESFHGWKVLGRAAIGDGAEGRAIIAALKRAIGSAEEVAGCFEPRHGLRATKGGQSLDLVICFSCRWIESHFQGTSSSVRIADSPKSAFNKALREAGIKLAQDVEGP